MAYEHEAEEQSTEGPNAMDAEAEARATDEGLPESAEERAEDLSQSLGEPSVDDDSDAPVRLDENGHREGFDEFGDVRAENVTLNQGGARDIEATTVSITQGGAAQVHAEQMSVSQGGVALARTAELELNEGSSVFAVVADNARIESGSNVFLLVAGSVEGEGRPVLDWRSALAIGAGLGLVFGLIRRILR